jgi:sulfite exporter TauE/SafE
LPFVALSRVGGWSRRKTLTVTLLCGVGHVASSVLLGGLGIVLGAAILELDTLKNIENQRGDLAGWLLVAFGLTYFVWGCVRAARNRPHTHLHGHADGTVHAHEHVHQGEHLHPHSAAAVGMSSQPASSFHVVAKGHAAVVPGRGSLTPWVLFTIFLFGPCEPLIPLVMYPAAQADVAAVVAVTVFFSAATLVTMSAMVAMVAFGSGALRWPRIERFSHALAGLVVLSCGVSIKCGL